MADVTYFVVLAFDQTERGRFIQRQPLTPQTEEAARRAAARLASGAAGVVAFSRTVNPDTGDWRDAVVLASYGALPAEMGADDGAAICETAPSTSRSGGSSRQVSRA